MFIVFIGIIIFPDDELAVQSSDGFAGGIRATLARLTYFGQSCCALNVESYQYVMYVCSTHAL